MNPHPSDPAPLADHSVFALSAACGFAVASLYYSQPLLPVMAASLAAGSFAQGAIAMLTQFGYASGLLLFGPLGDRLDRRALILTLLAVNVAALASCAMATSLMWLLIASAVLGLTAISAQVVIPAVSGRADPARRGQTVGRLMSGLFAGTLLARTVSGYLGAHFGWRTTFEVAAALEFVPMVLVWRFLPSTVPDTALAYPRLLRSLWDLLRTQPRLREACVTGFVLYAAFNVLWGSLALMLARPPYHWGSDVTGLFGLVGLTGMLASPATGRLADRWGGRRVVALAAVSIMAAFVLIAGAGRSMGWLLAGILLLDLGSRANLVANQTRLYAFLPHARGRLNTVFMTSYFLGGAMGSALGTAVAARFGWTGVSAAGLLCGAAALGATAKFRAAAGGREDAWLRHPATSSGK
ncbi:MFS transporter [Trinickia dabaoshanensis]|uniref:MFS transporter n=1 Tax=Trinickia dabaoshanensis TaxID=564714 RepID=UPI001E4BD787|nr:MFS transporter [Trinickia dabaoshanensis]